MIPELITLAIGLAAIAAVFVYTLVTGSPPTPTSPKVRNTLLALLPRRLPKVQDQDGYIYELGAGWGGNALALARAFPEHQVIAIERSPLPWIVFRLRQVFGRHENLSIVRADFMRRDLSDAALVVCYLTGDQMRTLAEKLEGEMAPASLVLTHTFAMPNWQTLDTVFANDLYKSPVYLYEMPPEPIQIGAVAVSSQAETSSST